MATSGNRRKYEDDIEYLDPAVAATEAYPLICLYGEFGKRKTTTACGLIVEHGLLISADNSWKVLKRTIHKDLLDKTELVVYDGLSQLEYINYTNYDTVIFDTFSKMVDNYLDLLLDNATWGGYREKLKSEREDLKGLEVVAPIDYRVLRDQFRPVLSHIMAQPVTKVFTFHVNDPIPGLSKDDTRKPRIPNSTWSMIAELADVIGYLHSKGKEIVVGVDEKRFGYVGKSRIDGVEGEMPIAEFIAAIKRPKIG